MYRLPEPTYPHNVQNTLGKWNDHVNVNTHSTYGYFWGLENVGFVVEWDYIYSSRTTVLKITMDRLQYTENDIPKIFDVAPYQDPIEWRSMIPMRFIAGAFGASITWNDATQTQTISLNGRSFYITVGQPLPGGMGTARIVSDRLMVPLRYISEQLGAQVSWDESTRTCIIVY